MLTGIRTPPSSDEFKHFGAALASFGSVALFHMAGITPEAHDFDSLFQGPVPRPRKITATTLARFRRNFIRHEDRVDVVVFAAPQLSLFEMQQISQLLRGRRIHAHTALLAATSPEIKSSCDRLGITSVIEAAGGLVLQGVCFYQMYARETGKANGWMRLLTNSAKLANIIAGYGYLPGLATTEQCIEAAIRGRVSG